MRQSFHSVAPLGFPFVLPMSGKVVHLHYKDEQATPERLNWVTGLQFSNWPESLVPARSVSEPSSEKARDEPLLDQVCRG